jgi:SAM-dependent methyltransferase
MRVLVEDRMEAGTVAVVTLRETPHAFDGVAPTYDRSNAENALLCAMRDRTRAALERAVPIGGHLLDLGCGPGTDVVYFAAKGYRVTAIDWSAAMVDEARRVVKQAGLHDRVRVFHLGIDQLDTLSDTVVDRFDAAYSSFGPFNCVVDLPRSARAIAGRVRAGGFLVASVIGRACPWEFALYTLRGDVGRAAIRFARRPVAVPLEGRTVWMQYYTPSAVLRLFEKVGFDRVSSRALGLFTPPPYLNGFAGRHPSLIAGLQRVEDTAGGWPGFRALGDHFLIVMRRA